MVLDTIHINSLFRQANNISGPLFKNLDVLYSENLYHNIFKQ